MNLSTPGALLPSEPSVAVAPGGRAIIAWWRRDATLAPKRDVVQIRRRASFTAPFVGPVTLSRRVSNAAPQPDAAATAGGLALVGWTDETHAVGLCVLPGTGPAVPTTLIPEDGPVRLSELGVGIGASGGGAAVWTRGPSFAGGVGRTVRMSTRAPATGAWSAPSDLSASGGEHPAVAVAPDGSAIVAWERAGVIEASVRTGVGAFGAPSPLSAPAAVARRPAVAVNAAGEAVVAWYEEGVMVAERPAGGSFASPRLISALGGFPDVANLGPPVTSVAADGRAVAAWRRRIGGRFRVEAALRPAGADWGPARILSPLAPRNVGQPSLGADAAGHAVVAWSQPVGTSLSAIRARALPKAGTAFGALESVSTKAGRGTAPSVGLDAAGRAVLAWREDPVGGPGRFLRAAIRFSPG